MISIIHNAEIVDIGKICRKTGQPIQKYRCILDYNQHMKGVDRADQYLSYYPIYRKTIKWSKKVALYLFNCSLFNAFRVYQHMNVNYIIIKLCDFVTSFCIHQDIGYRTQTPKRILKILQHRLIVIMIHFTDFLEI